jgi:hypothetical protein
MQLEPEFEFYGVCVCFTGVRATGARQSPIQQRRVVGLAERTTQPVTALA